MYKRQALQSLGEKVLPLFSSVIEFLGKVVFVLVFIPRFAYDAVILCEPVVLENGARYLVWNAPFYAVLGMLLSTRYALQSMGEKVLPLLSSVIEFLGKIVFVLLFIPRFEYNAVILCEPVIWCFMTLELLIAYRHNPFVFPKKK